VALIQACVAIAPIPAIAQGVTTPMATNLDWTATPNSPVWGSRATIENVMDVLHTQCSPEASDSVTGTINLQLLQGYASNFFLQFYVSENQQQKCPYDTLRSNKRALSST
jgi:hypothetical protein